MTTATAQTAMFEAKEGVRPQPARTEMEHAFFTSDSSYDGVFYTGVKSTGIFCRPSCRAKKPRPENVEFFPAIKSALFAGYRPCRRCRPLEVNGGTPEWVQTLLARIDQAPGGRISATELSSLGIEPARARRYFQQNFGLTFQEYCRSRRMAKGLAVIREGGSVDEAVFESGYESHSGFRQEFGKTFGVTPGQSRGREGAARGAAMECVHLAWMQTPLGPLIAGSTEEGICLLEFTDRRMLEHEMELLRRRWKRPLTPGETRHHRQLRAELNEYFSGKRREFTVPLVLFGSEFEKRVWNELLRIPFGNTRSYEEMAQRIGNPLAVRAVGTANGRNNVSIVVPCHRVINKNGELGGYGGGLWRKRLLLHLEQTGESL